MLVLVLKYLIHTSFIRLCAVQPSCFACSHVVAPPAVKSWAETRSLQLQTLRVAQTQRIGTAHAVEVRKQELAARAKQLIVELYVALHSAPRFTTLVGDKRGLAQRGCLLTDLNFFTFAGVAFTPFIQRRFNSMTSGQGAAAAKAFVALAAQLPSEAIDALNGEQAAAIANVSQSGWAVRAWIVRIQPLCVAGAG